MGTQGDIKIVSLILKSAERRNKTKQDNDDRRKNGAGDIYRSGA